MFSSVCVLRNSSLGPNFSQKKSGLSCAKKRKNPLFFALADFLFKNGSGGCCLGLCIHGFFKENEL